MLTRPLPARIFFISLPIFLLPNFTSAVTLTPTVGPALIHALNLVQNGSFEDHPGPPAASYYWIPANPNFTTSPANWTPSGSVDAYAQWAIDTIVLNAPPATDGLFALYFGNGTVASTSQVPTFNNDGTVSYPSAPTITSTYGAPVTLSQTINGLTPSAQYKLSFWVTGESELNAEFSHDGIFGLDLTGYSTTYLTVPNDNTSPVGPEHVYLFDFIAPASSVTLTFTNWGDYFEIAPNNTFPANWPYSRSTELILDDVIINLVSEVPEPTSLALLALPLAALLLPRPRRGQS